MGWENYHLWEFVVDKTCIGESKEDFEDNFDDGTDLNADEIILRTFLPEKSIKNLSLNTTFVIIGNM